MGDRGVSVTLSYVLVLAISTVLVVGLLTAGSGFVDDQRNRVAESELRVIGERLAGDIATADRLVQANDGATNVTLVSSLPESVSGASYRVFLVPEDGNVSLLLRTTALSDGVTVRLPNTTAIAPSTATDGRVAVVYDPAAGRLEVTNAG